MPSTAIQRIVYDETRQVLSVWFVPSGRRYSYIDVPPEVYRAFRAAFSKGRFFNVRIRNRFAHRVEPDAAA